MKPSVTGRKLCPACALRYGYEWIASGMDKTMEKPAMMTDRQQLLVNELQSKLDMDRNTAFVFAGSFLLSFILYRSLYLRKKNEKQLRRIPPQLPSLPIVGSLPFVPPFPEMHTFFMEKYKSLGEVIGLRMGSKYVVIFNSHKAIHEALVKNNNYYCERPWLYVNQIGFNPQHTGIAYHLYNDKYKLVHQASLSIVKAFGYGKRLMDERINEEVKLLIQKLRNTNGQSVFPGQMITGSVLRVVYRLMFGKRYNYGTEALYELGDLIQAVVGSMGAPMLVEMCHLFYYFPRYRKICDKLISDKNKLLAFIDREAAVAMTSAEDNFVQRFTDIEALRNEKEELRYVLRDFFLAGTDTTSVTLQWAVILLANNPRVLKKLQKEIDDYEFEGEFVPYTDRFKLPYFEATTMEIMRVKTIVPMSFPHITTADTEICGFFIPKGTETMPNLHSAHLNPAFWKEPQTFCPERHLNDKGEVIGRDLVIPFGLGRRSCIGELLSRQEIFFQLFAFVKNFDILPPEGETTITYHEEMSLVLAPSNYKARFIARQASTTD